MAWLRGIVGVLLLVPSVGCTLCCSPFDNCGPLCNGECGAGCCTTSRAGGYAGQMAYYEEQIPGPRLAPTPARPRVAPPQAPVQEPIEETTPETESPSDTTTPEAPFDTYEPSDTGVPGTTETQPEATTPDEFPDTLQDDLPPFDQAFPQQEETTVPEDSGIPME